MEDVELILYDKSRHEILNDAEKEQVFQDIFQWISVKSCEYSEKLKNSEFPANLSEKY